MFCNVIFRQLKLSKGGNMTDTYSSSLPEVSFIIPVYNGEKTISDCVLSIINDNYSSFEIIIVDDGSKDNTETVCTKLANEDNRIKYIRKENAGVSEARNTGISAAKGKYIRFSDCDDMIIPGSTQKMVDLIKADSSDVVIGDFIRIVNDRSRKRGSIQKAGKYSLKDFSLKLMKAPADIYYAVVWNRLYIREKIQENHIHFPAGRQWCEDLLFNFDYLLQSNSVSVLKEPIYKYFYSPKGLVSSNMTPGKIVKMKTSVYAHYKRYYQSIGLYKKHRLAIAYFLIDIANDSVILPEFKRKKSAKKKELNCTK